MMCRRHFGVDSDGIIDVRCEGESGFHLGWRTCLGFENKLCRNSTRAFVAYLKISGIYAGNDDVTFLVGDGYHYGNYNPDTRESWASILDVNQSNVNVVSEKEYVIETPMPHLVIFTDYDVTQMSDMYQKGVGLSEKFKQYTGEGAANVIVDFVFEKDGILYSRCCNKNLGKENISCGTGTVAIGECTQ